MPLPPGLYKLAFRNAQGTDYGVAYMQDGKLRGGDSGMAYVGSYKEDGNVLQIQLSVTQHRHVPGVVSVLGYNDMVVEMHGPVGNGTASLRGSAPEVPGVKFEARLSHIAD